MAVHGAKTATASMAIAFESFAVELGTTAQVAYAPATEAASAAEPMAPPSGFGSFIDPATALITVLS
tara:strand:- start:77 stop:277 length:201 start_codon:yes stop_codon:yes gene_type:complete